METKTKTQEFLILLTENRTTEAKRILGHVEYELSMLPSTLVPRQQAVVKEINAIIVRLQEGYDGSAIAKASPALANFAQYRLHSLIKSFLGKDVTRYYDPQSGQGDSYVDIPSKIKSRHRVAGWQNILSDFSNKERTTKETKNLWTFPGIDETDEILQIRKERETSGQDVERNKVSNGHADINTPMLVAERFRELYNNEWREAFSVLRAKHVNERKAMQLLLLIVEEAYRFCQQEAERQLQDIHSAFLDILEFGANMGNVAIEWPAELVLTSGQSVYSIASEELNWPLNIKTKLKADHLGFIKDRGRPAELSLVATYRKGMAAAALQKLCKVFYDQKFKEITAAKLGVVPDKKGAGTSYANRAVEITWWMCVQEPPVYMIPTSKEAFDPKLYETYGKSSTQPDYFVWPALRYSQFGDVLAKGVVQYK